jgi:predicted nucleic acid-binding protein
MSDVLVDTSVWLKFFKKPNSPYSEKLDTLLEEGRVCTCDLVKAEIIPGAKNRKQYDELKDYFGALPSVQEPEHMWESIMETRFAMKRAGLNSGSIPDLMIAVIAKEPGCSVFAKDADFKDIQKILPFRLLEEWYCPGYPWPQQ